MNYAMIRKVCNECQNEFEQRWQALLGEPHANINTHVYYTP